MGQQGSKSASNGISDFGDVKPGGPTMRAWVATAPSPSATNLTNVSLLSNVPIPEPTASQVRVKVYSASLNRVDIGRAISSFCTFPAILGTDGAGVVEKVGDEAASAEQGIAVGDKVFFHLDTAGTSGTMAEYCIVELLCLTKIDNIAAAAEGAGECSTSSTSNASSNPTNNATNSNNNGNIGQSGVVAVGGTPIVSFNEAATLPSAAWTAFVALFDKLKIERGRVIFIDGAAGGVGSYAVQMSKMMGLFVIGTCSTYNVDYLKELGVDVVVDYVMDDIPDRLREWTQSRGVDYFLELVSPDQGERYLKHIRFGGSICLVGGVMGGGGGGTREGSSKTSSGGATSSFPATPLSASTSGNELLFLNQISVHHVNLNGMHRDPITWPLFNYLGAQTIAMLENKSLRPCYHEVIPFEQAKDALAQLANGHAKGKIVLRVVSRTAAAHHASSSAAIATSAAPSAAVSAPPAATENSSEVVRTASSNSSGRVKHAPTLPPILKPESPDDVRVVTA